MVKRENAVTVDIVEAIVIRNYIKLGKHVKKWSEFFFGWLDSAGICCGFDSRKTRLKTRLDSTQSFYGSAFAASAAVPGLRTRVCKVIYKSNKLFDANT